MKPSNLFSITLFGPDGWREKIFLEPRIMSIGSHLGAQIRHPAMAEGAAELRFEEGEWVLYQTNPSVSLTFREEPIQSKKLNPGDQLKLDDFRLLFDYSRPEMQTAETLLDDESQRIAVFQLRVLRGPDKGTVFTLKPGQYVIGREGSSFTGDIPLKDDFLSRNHVSLHVDKRNILITDLGSRNGTYVNRKRIHAVNIFQNADLEIGKSCLKIERVSIGDTQQTKKINSNQSVFRILWMLFFILSAGSLFYLIYKIIY